MRPYIIRAVRQTTVKALNQAEFFSHTHPLALF